MKTRGEYKNYFAYCEGLQIQGKLEPWEKKAIAVHAFDAIVVLKLFTAEELAEHYPAILHHIKKEYKELDFI